jgi:tRNA-Thr(GGU) m(6)t(6)A37 methyltransferase TsaA
MEIKPIGIIHSPFTTPEGIPIQPVFAKDSEATVEVYEEYKEALADLEGFERIWLLFWLDRASKFKPKVKPYMDNQMRGLFSTRAPSRPNPIGMSCVKLLGVEGNILKVAQVDILDGTPLLDIKPYIAKVDCFEIKRNGWLDAIKERNTKADNRFYKNSNESGDKV